MFISGTLPVILPEVGLGSEVELFGAGVANDFAIDGLLLHALLVEGRRHPLEAQIDEELFGHFEHPVRRVALRRGLVRATRTVQHWYRKRSRLTNFT